MSAPIDVLAVMGEAIKVLKIAGCLIHAKELTQSYEAVAELIKAIRESRIATQAFADDGHHKNWVRYDVSEERLTAALAKVGLA